MIYPTLPRFKVFPAQGHLAHKQQPPRRTLQQGHAKAPMVVLEGGGAISYERATPVSVGNAA